MATRKSATSRSTKGTSSRTRRTQRTTRRTTRSTTRRRTPSGSLYPRRRASRPGLPTTVGAALGTLVVTTLLDLSWPLRLVLIAVVLVVGVAYVVWRHRAEITAAGAAGAQAETAEPAAPADTTEPTPPTSPA